MGGRQRQGLWPAGVGCHAAGTLLDLVARWDQDLAVRQYAVTTRQSNLSAIGLFLAWLAEREVQQAAQVTRAMIEVYQRHLHRSRQADERPLSPMAQYRRLKVIEQFFRWAVRKAYVPANPASDLDYPRVPSLLPETLSVQELTALFNAVDVATPDGLRERAAMELMYSTGLRRAEVVRLDTSDIDAARGVVRVRQGKGNRDRLVPIGQRALLWLNRYLTQARPHYAHDAGDYRIFLQPGGLPCSPGMLGGRIGKVMRAAGITKKGACHLFRHSMASHLLEAGCDVRVIGQMLGHTNLSATARYTRVGVQALCRMHAAFHPAEQGGDSGSSSANEAGQNAGEVTP